MKAMILAAGRGERMRPLTDHTPKPLLEVNGQSLIEYHLHMLRQLGITEVIINHAWLGEQIPQKLGDGRAYGLRIHYSAELAGALETAGGIVKALPLLQENAAGEPFLVINGDIFLSAPLASLPELAPDKLAHLWLVENPEHNLNGDFALQGKLVTNDNDDNIPRHTFSGIALYRPEFFADINSAQEAKLALGPLLRQTAEQGKISGQLLAINWTDVGTPERLARLNQQVKTSHIRNENADLG